jgi:hypothetical protein
MRTDELRPRSANGLHVLSGHHKHGELDQRGDIEAVGGKQCADVCEHLFGLF